MTRSSPVASDVLERLNAIADCLIVDPFPVDAYGRFKLTYGDLRAIRAALQPSSPVTAEALRAQCLKAICTAGERCSCADRNWQWRDHGCQVAMEHVNAIVAVLQPAQCSAGTDDGYRAAWLELIELCNNLKRENFELRAAMEECAKVADIWAKDDDAPAEGEWLRGRRYGSEQAGKQIASAIRRMASTLTSTQGEQWHGAVSIRYDENGRATHRARDPDGGLTDSTPASPNRGTDIG